MTMAERDMVNRAKAITREMATLREHLELAAAERRKLILQLVDEFGWSEREVARELGISQPAVHHVLNKKETENAQVTIPEHVSG